MLVRHQFGSDIDWHIRLFDDVESTVSVSCQFFINNLAASLPEDRGRKVRPACRPPDLVAVQRRASTQP